MPAIKPRLIHPVFIFIARLDKESSLDNIDSELGSRRRGGRKSVFKGLDSNGKLKRLPNGNFDTTGLERYSVQKKNNRLDHFDKTRGNWTKETKISFLGLTDEMLDQKTKQIKFGPGDKIVLMIDRLGRTVKEFQELTIRDALLRGEYDRFHFVELLAEKEIPA